MAQEHYLKTLTDALSTHMKGKEQALTNYLKSGVLPMEAEQTDEEMLFEWQNMKPDEVINEIKESPSAFLKRWDHMKKLEAKAAANVPPPPPLASLGVDPLAPYGGPAPDPNEVDPLAAYTGDMPMPDPSMADPSMMAPPQGAPIDPSMMPPMPDPNAMPPADGMMPPGGEQLPMDMML